MAPYHQIDAIHAIRDLDGLALSVVRSSLTRWTRSILEESRLLIRAPVIASVPNSTLYVAIGAGVGGLLLLAIALVVFQIVRKRRAHRRQMSTLAEEQPVATSEQHSNVTSARSSSRWSTFVTWHNKDGWAAFPSQESINGSNGSEEAILPPQRTKSKRFRQRGLPLKKMKHLSAITESPRSRTGKSPSIIEPESTATPDGLEPDDQANNANTEDVFNCPGSPKTDVLPSYAIKSPGRYGAAIAGNERIKPLRSISVGAISSDGSNFGDAVRLVRPQMHSRSISLGAPRTQPPSMPVPPVPFVSPRTATSSESNRQGLLVRKLSCSSQESANSSVLVTSPIIQMRRQLKDGGSPAIEQVVAEDEFAQLKSFKNKRWHNPLIQGPRKIPSPNQENNSPYRNGSIHSNLAHFSIDQPTSQRMSSSSSVSSLGSQSNRLSVPQLRSTDRTRLSRVSSTGSYTSSNGTKPAVTPKKASRSTSVSIYGSPAQRKRVSVLRDISGNAAPLSRESSAVSTSSSNGNPFKWDTPIQKPSALKGSPNARKGHKRQNCVRISTLTPQVLGPPPSRPTSPNIAYGIEEEPSENEGSKTPLKMRFVSNQRISRPSSTMSLRIQTLRASVTPSSPTLSHWNYGESDLPSQPMLTASPVLRTGSAQSNRSSLYSIPCFPAPSKPTVSAVQRNLPVPEFSLSRPSMDIQEEDESSPKVELPSSPPVRNDVLFDSGWPMITIPAPEEPQDYESATENWDPIDSDGSSSPFQFPQGCHDMKSGNKGLSPQKQRVSYGVELPDTPPHSPKTMPEGFMAFFDKKDSATKPARLAKPLSTTNSNSVMSNMPAIDLNGMPVLSSPMELSPYVTLRLPVRQHMNVDPLSFRPLRPAPSPPQESPEAQMPAPLNIKSATQTSRGPLGPRSEPAKSVLKNAMALRRMNSEIDNTCPRESRCYVRLGREPSTILPLVGNPDMAESRNNLFDFGFGGDTASGAEEHPLDNIEMTDLENCIDGALAGFDTAANAMSDKSPSVWEDGESFWKEQRNQRVGLSGLSLTSSSPLVLQSTPTPMPDTVKRNALKTPATAFRMPTLSGSSPSKGATKTPSQTPMSLYDADGFLRT